jgi:hypothetical protein
MTPSAEELLRILHVLEERALQQVAMQRRIGGYLNVIKWGVGLACFLLFCILLSVSK